MSISTSSRAGHAESIVPGVSPELYSQRDFERISAMVREQAGIVLPEGKKMLAYSRIAPLLRRSGHTTFAGYLDALAGNPQLAVATVAALTTNHTYFNRESHHFDHFVEHVRPDLLSRAAAGEAIRLWSAGCSSGEEIWTLIMVLLGEDKIAGNAILGQDIVALASDLAEHVLINAEAATYSAEAISSMPEKLRHNWCQAAGDTVTVNDKVRQLVRFRRLNLLRNWPFSNLFDVIFCRNVMIYFDHSSKQELVLKLAQQLKAGGYLYIGHSERVLGPANDLLDAVGPTVYRRRSA